MSYLSRKFWTQAGRILVITALIAGMIAPLVNLSLAQAAASQQGSPVEIGEPVTFTTAAPTVFMGDLRDLPQLPAGEGGELPAPMKIPQVNPDLAPSINPVDPVAQNSFAQGQMPEPIMNFEGLTKAEGGGWTPPDTNGDIGPNHYIQTVNIAIGIYDKTTGAELVKMSFNDFFQGPVGQPCDNNNRGDVVVMYDPYVDRWIVTDFSLPGPNYYECIAVSASGDPVAGGWYYYQIQTNIPPFSTAFGDYPKLGVWSDGWYMSANMFTATFVGVSLWAFDRADALVGAPMDVNMLPCMSGCASLLPANVRGSLPPAGMPEIFASIEAPDKVDIFYFQSDFVAPFNPTFLGPFQVPVANFSFAGSVPQMGTGQMLDSLGDRMMFQLQYRNFGDGERLYATHSVNTGGVVGVRWYEISDPGNGAPQLVQQGTYQPDQHYRWMGSIAADQDGNIAVGYSVSSSTMFPAIRYAGRLAGETPNLLTQNEAVLFQGPGSQSGSARWGDYSDMTVDPVDDCTFWYTQEYATTGSNWRTRIGSFKFPSCGEPKGAIEGFVYDAITSVPLAGVPVSAVGAVYNFSTVTDATGFYSIPLIAGSYDVTAGPFLPAYPTPVTVNLTVTPPNTTVHDFYLEATPNLVDAGIQLFDPLGNNNGFPEPGETGLELFEALLNDGGATSTGITAHLTSLTPGVTLQTADTAYPDIPAGGLESNITPYLFSIDQTVACGSDMAFEATITDDISTYSTSLLLNVGVPQLRTDFYFNDVENGVAGWTTGGVNNTWGITESTSHSPTHSWTDSPSGNYVDNTNSWVRTPTLDLTGVKSVQLSGWFRFDLEVGYDYVYIEYSLDGGTTWQTGDALAVFNGTQTTWQQLTVDTPMLDNQSQVAIRYRLESDGGVIGDGFYLDDIALSYIPFACDVLLLPDAPSLVSPADGSWVSDPVTFTWQPADTGAPTEGYIFYLDNTPVMTFTQPITTTTLEVTPWAHTWFVKATNGAGESAPSPVWSFDVFGRSFLPFVEK